MKEAQDPKPLLGTLRTHLSELEEEISSSPESKSEQPQSNKINVFDRLKRAEEQSAALSLLASALCSFDQEYSQHTAPGAESSEPEEA